MAELLAFIPARAGSKRVKNKNLLPVGGVPLVVRAVEMAKGFTDNIVVSTDSDVIAQLVAGDGVRIVGRSEGLFEDFASLDEVITDFLWKWLEDTELDVLVIQPTMVMFPYPIADIDAMRQTSLTSALAIRAHGVWARKHIGPRVNLQDVPPDKGSWQELGIRFYPAGSNDGAVKRIQKITTPMEWVDIDTPSDLVAADRLMSKLHIVFRFVYGTDIGAGHLNRVLTLANHLQHHIVTLTNISGEMVPDSMAGGWPLSQYENTRLDYPESGVGPVGTLYNYDAIVNDVLDTTASDMAMLRQYAPVIAVEDSGPGAALATHVVNALYKEDETSFTGSDWAILRPEFLLADNIPIKDRDIDVLVTFGGTDPNGLTDRLHSTFAENGYEEEHKVVYVPPPGAAEPSKEASPNMASLLRRSKMVFTSGGRTLYEAAAVGTPAFVISQNIRETTHAHLGFEFGNHDLGMHNFLTRNEVLASLRYTTDETLQLMSDQAYKSIDRKGLDRFLSLIEFTAMEGQ